MLPTVKKINTEGKKKLRRVKYARAKDRLSEQNKKRKKKRHLQNPKPSPLSL